jgi:hypothetical protein
LHSKQQIFSQNIWPKNNLGHAICRIIFKPAPRPIYVKDNQDEHLYIRSGNSTRKLTVKEAIGYVKTRWPE